MTKASRDKLKYCDSSLIELVNAVDKIVPLCVCCGYRNKEEQEKAFKEKKSRAHYGQSPHNCTPSKGVDLAPLKDGKIDWNDTEAFTHLATVMKDTAHILHIEITWGGGWASFPDLPHFELRDWKL